jgi:hypothetical protein
MPNIVAVPRELSTRFTRRAGNTPVVYLWRQDDMPALFDGVPNANHDGLGGIVARGKKKSLKERAE